MKQGGVYKPKLFATSKPHTSTSTNLSSRNSAADYNNHGSPTQHLTSKVSLYLDNTEVAFNLDMTNNTGQTTPTQKRKLTTNTCDNCAALIPLVQSRLKAHPALPLIE